MTNLNHREVQLEFSRLVRKRRAEEGLSQLELAVRAEVTPSTVPYAESGGGLSLRNALPIARVLGINLMELP